MMYLCVIIWLVIGIISASFIINTDRNIHYHYNKEDYYIGNFEYYSVLFTISLFGLIAAFYTIDFYKERVYWKKEMSIFYKY